MGNQQHHYSVLTMPGEGQWKQSQKADHCTIIKNQETGQEAEVYTVAIADDRSLKDQLEMYEYRKINKTKLVSVHHVRKANSKGLCSGTDTYQVITERIPLRLGQVQNLQIPEAMHILKQSLSGFQLIYQSIEGPIQITKDMIGFTPEGKVKIWINPNFAINMPERSSYIRGQAYQFDESVMPLQLIKIIEEQIPNRSFPLQFKARIQQQSKNVLSFSRAKVILRNFCIDNNIPMLERLNLYEEMQDVLTSSLPRDNIMITQETIIKKNPPAQILQPANVSIVKTVPTDNPALQINVNQTIPQPLVKRISQQSPSNQVRSAPTDQIVIGQPSQNIQNGISSKSQFLNYDMEFPMSSPTPIINTIPLRPSNFTPPGMQDLNRPPLVREVSHPRPQVVNYQQITDYHVNPSNIIHNPSLIDARTQPPINNFRTIRQSPEKQPMNPNFGQNIPYPNNQYQKNITTIPMNPQFSSQSANNFKQNHKFQLESLPKFSHSFSSSNLIPFNSSQIGPLDSNPNYYINNFNKQPSQQRFQTNNAYPQNVSPMRNSPYLPNGGLSRENSLASFQVNDPRVNISNNYFTPNKQPYQFSTSAKKSNNSPIFEGDSFGDLKRPLFKNYQPQSQPKKIAPSNHDDDLIRKIQQLTQHIQQQINEVTSESRANLHRPQNYNQGKIMM